MKPVNLHDDRFLALLQRWINGDINRVEEQELRLLTRDDPFRKEAWEGLQALPEEDHEARIQSLQKKLHQKTDRKSVPLWPRLMAIAASLALLLTAVWYFGPVAGDKSAPQFAQQEAAPATDSIEEPMPASAPLAVLEKPVAPPLPSKKSAPNQGPVVSRQAVAPEKDLYADDELAGATDISTESTSEVEPVIAYSAPPELEQVATKASPAPAPAMKEEARDGLKQQQAQEAMKSARRSEPGAPGREVVPELGWDNFQRYLQTNARLTPAARNNNVTGFVQLEFELDPEGNPTQFKVLKSLGFGCDEAAIELVKNSKWQGPSGKSQKVDVWFRR